MTKIYKATFIKEHNRAVTVNDTREQFHIYSPEMNEFTKNGGIIQLYSYSKEELIAKIDAESSSEILTKYPSWKQHNLTNRIKTTDTDEAFAEMQTFIRNVLAEADEKKYKIRTSVIDK